MSTGEHATGPDLAGVLDLPIPYIARVRSYYQGLGYGAPYTWAKPADEPPFTPLAKPLSQCRVAIVTTAAPLPPDTDTAWTKPRYDASIKFYKVYSAPSQIEPVLRIHHVAIDWDHTTAQDQGTYFPLRALRRAAIAGRIGTVAPHFFGMPTNRSQKTTVLTDAPELVRRAREVDIDAALLVPNCPVCHQTMALAARALEVAGISTVVMGAARDIVEYVGVPRLLFSDFPLGNACGKPGDEASQTETLELALRLLERAPAARTTLASPLKWSLDPAWKLDYSNIHRLQADEIARRRAEFDAVKVVAKQVKASS